MEFAKWENSHQGSCTTRPALWSGPVQISGCPEDKKKGKRGYFRIEKVGETKVSNATCYCRLTRCKKKTICVQKIGEPEVSNATCYCRLFDLKKGKKTFWKERKNKEVDAVRAIVYY